MRVRCIETGSTAGIGRRQSRGGIRLIIGCIARRHPWLKPERTTHFRVSSMASMASANGMMKSQTA